MVRMTKVKLTLNISKVMLFLFFFHCSAHHVSAEESPYLIAPDSLASSEAEMKPYRQKIRYSDDSFEMVPIPGGDFIMGSPLTEKKRELDEGPQHRIHIEPFWMGKHEITWDEFGIWLLKLDTQQRENLGIPPTDVDRLADARTGPSRDGRGDFTFGMGYHKFPAVGMTQFAAKRYCQWLTIKTGQYYRLPTEAEWEYACRAGTMSSYSFGDDLTKLDDYAWHYENSEETTHKVGTKKPNPWGLYDMHGNVAEWCLDQYDKKFYSHFPPEKEVDSPLCIPITRYPCVVRGGSWFDDPELLRSAARVHSEPSWDIQNPLPSNLFFLFDGDFLGFRLVRPLRQPSQEEIRKKVLGPVPLKESSD